MLRSYLLQRIKCQIAKTLANCREERQNLVLLQSNKTKTKRYKIFSL